LITNKIKTNIIIANKRLKPIDNKYINGCFSIKVPKMKGKGNVRVAENSVKIVPILFVSSKYSPIKA
jgi:hypothetical protein